jgi:hypothetical protein
MKRCSHLRPKLFLWTSILLLAGSTAGLADAPPFDLAGPKVDVHVQRDGKTLPIAEVPNLLPGDRLWIHPDLPESQSVHYLLIVAFLRGSTNQPPPDWFKRVETWDKQVRQEGVFVVVPAEAQQALIFLAPETGGDFSTLRNAVRGRPGAFVRASQDLQQASWDRLRLDAYLAAVKKISNEATNGLPNDPAAALAGAATMKERTELAARSLGIRIDQQCFDKPSEQQAPCLVQHTDGLVLDDSMVQTTITQLTNGSAADMMNQLSYAPLAGGGNFSPYVGALVDLVRILSTVHTAKYQYIPALALPQKEQGDTLNLRLNVPPSFRDPKSVIVVALPPIGPGTTPQLRVPEPAVAATTGGNQNSAPKATEPAVAPAPPATYCATKPDLTLAVEGAPLVFATSLSYDLTLHLEGTSRGISGTPSKGTGTVITPAPSLGPTPTLDRDPHVSASEQIGPDGIDIPIVPDPSRGGFVLQGSIPTLPQSEITAQIRGKWGFTSWDGPKFHLIEPHPGGWVIPATDQNALITDREDMVHIQGGNSICVAAVDATLPQNENAKPVKLAWKSPRPDQLEVVVPLKNSPPGKVTIAILQYGLPAAEELPLKAYAEAAAVDHFTLSAGDKVAVLKGKRLDEVESADLAGITFAPAALNRVQDFDQLELAATGVTLTLRPGNSYSAKITLRDGRTVHVPATVTGPRPQVDLLSKGVQHDESEADASTVAGLASVVPVHLGSPSDLPLQRRLVFFLRTRVPETFPRSEKIEIASADSSEGSFQTTLSFSDGSLMLEDAHTAVAVIDPLARFGPSAFGPIQLRAVTSDGVTGDWVPLGTLVRLPGFTAANALRCPRSPAKPCLLMGTNLFLVTAVGTTPDMANAVDVPAEFAGNALTVPNVARQGTTGTLYLRLRDDPATVQTVSLPVAPVAASSALADSSDIAVPVPAGKGDAASAQVKVPTTTVSAPAAPPN